VVCVRSDAPKTQWFLTMTHTETDPSNPEARSGIRLIDDPYARVAAAFEDFVVHTDEYGVAQRGGFRTTDTPRVEADMPRHEDYHVESSFNPNQRAYVRASIAALHILAQGRVLAGEGGEVTPFAGRIVTHFFDQDPAKASFAQALHDAMLDLWDDFGRLYPNLTPALEAMGKVAGIQGMRAAFLVSQDKLREALTGEEPLSKLFESPHAAIEVFTAIEPIPEISPVEFERWCSGERFAKYLMRQAGKAAQTLASTQGIEEAHDDDRQWQDSLKAELYDRVEAYAAAAADAHARGELA
jgi:hypothetical protein